MWDERDRAREIRRDHRSVSIRRGTTVASVAIAWALAWPGVTGAIVGGRARPAREPRRAGKAGPRSAA